MKLLNGSELAGYIKERQLKQVRNLRQASNIFPKLAIVYTGNNPTIDTYMRLKSEYGKDILVDVEIFNPMDIDLINQIETLNNDEDVHGIIVQLPLADPNQTDEAVNTVNSQKDVDGLGENAQYTPATAMAIDWLLAGYNVDLYDKKIAIVGNGRLVGKPLANLWNNSGYNVSVYDSKTEDLTASLLESDIIIAATGVPGLIKSDMIKNGAVLVDAGTAAEHGKIVGDVAGDVRDRDDLVITPVKGGVGPLTVCALFENVILAARKRTEKNKQI